MVDQGERKVDIREIPDAPVLALVNFGEFGEGEDRVRLDMLKIKDIDGDPVWIPQFVQLGNETYPLDQFDIPGEKDIGEEWNKRKKRFEGFLMKTKLPISLACYVAFNTDEEISDYVGKEKLFLCSIYGPAGFGKSALCAVLRYQMGIGVMDWDSYSDVSLESYENLIDKNFKPEENLRRLANLSENERKTLAGKPKEQKSLGKRLAELADMYKTGGVTGGVMFLDMPGVEVGGGRKADIYDIFARFGTDDILLAAEGQNISDFAAIVGGWDDFTAGIIDRSEQIREKIAESLSGTRA